MTKAALLPSIALFLAPLGAPALAAPVQSAEGLDGLVADELAEASDRSVAELFDRALELRGADHLGAGEDLDRALERRLEERDALSPRATFLLAAARLLGETPDMTVIAETLGALLGAPDDELASAAAGMLGDSAFRDLPKPVRDDLVDRLLEGARDDAHAPGLRMRFAQSAFSIGGRGAARNDARDVLRDFLGSNDPALRASAALALGASGAQPIEGPLRVELERLQRLPDERGELASVLLKQERLREHYDRRLRDQRKLLAASGQLPPELEEFEAVLGMIEERHLEGSKVTEEELIEAALEGMLQWMDPHSSYLSSAAYSRFFQDLEAEYGGIGAYVNTDPDTGLFTIVQPIYSGPAYEAGLKTDDKVVRIDTWPTLGKDRDEIIKRLKGKPDTDVKLYVWRRGMDTELIDRPTEDMAVTITRALVEIPAGTWQLLPGGVGLVELNTFSRVAQEELRSWIPQMLDDGMRALILDMRRNSGGLLDEARDVADLFLDRNKVVVSTEGRERRPQSLKTRHPALVPEDMPIVILTSRMTASAAEIVSGALQDHDRATVVGKTTFGKGSVQQLLAVDGTAEDQWSDENRNGRWDPWEPLTVDHDGDGEVDYAPRVKLTVARYLLPSGRSIHRELDEEGNLISEGGVEPDVVVNFPPIERWQYEEERRVVQTGAISQYVDEHWDANRTLFGQLALNDGKDPSLYPDFDRLMTSLSTTLPRDDVRRVLRNEIRRRVQDDRGAQFPWGDFVEDVQVQRAIEIALEELGESPDDVTEFGLVFDFDPEAAVGQSRLAVLRDSAEITRIRSSLQAARDGGVQLSDEELDELLSILNDLDEE